jgi:hypothetical protein
MTTVQRDWHQYNEKLVNEAVDLFVDRNVFDSFRRVDSLNNGKVGRPFLYANNVILMILAVGSISVYLTGSGGFRRAPRRGVGRADTELHPDLRGV